MALKEYEVEIGGIPHTIQLDDEDAKARGLAAKKSAAKSAAAPKNKAAAPAANK